MSSFIGGNLGVTWGFIPHEDGWADSYNLNFQRLDTVVQLSVISILDTPPGSPGNEDRYIVGATPTGAWVGHETEIAVWTKKEDPDSRAWVFIVPVVGWQSFNEDDGSFHYFDGEDWLPFPSLPALGTDGQVLTIVAGVATWADPVEELPASTTNGYVLTLVAGVAAWAAPTGGTGFDLTEGGAWAGDAAFTKGTFVTFGGKRYVASVDIAAPAGTPGLDGSAFADGAGATLVVTGLDTVGTADTVCVVAAWNHDGTSVSSIVSTSGLTFVQRASQTRTNISGHRLRVELWTAPVSGALTNEDVTITLSDGAPSDSKAVVFGVYGGDISDPLDAHADSLKTASGDRTAPGVTAFSTSNADDLLIFIAASDSDGSTGLVANTAPATWTLLNYQGNAANDGTPNVVNLAVSTKLVSATQSAIAISDGGDPSVWGAIAIAVKASGAANLSPDVSPLWVPTSEGLDTLLGTTEGSIAVRGATVWESLLPGDDNQVLTVSGGIPLWSDNTGGGGSGAGGLYRQVMSLTPTTSNTGFSAWYNQGGATVNNRDTGLSISAPINSGDSLRGRTQAAPATPYHRKALIGLSAPLANYSVSGVGWTDGTGVHAIELAYNAGWKLEVAKWTNSTTISGTDFAPLTVDNPIWVWIEDDGTNVIFKFSVSGDDDDFIILFSVAKASGFLGASGYTNLIFFANRNGTSPAQPAIGTLLSWGDPAGVIGGTVYRLEAPTTGATIVLDAADELLVVNPAAAIAALTVTMPTGVDGQRIDITTRQRIDALTITGTDWPGGELPQFGTIGLLYVGPLSTWVMT